MSIVERLCDDPQGKGWTETCHQIFVNQNADVANLNQFADFCFRQLNNPELAIENFLRKKQVAKVVQVQRRKKLTGDPRAKTGFQGHRRKNHREFK